jgi:hypothetical protein
MQGIDLDRVKQFAHEFKGGLQAWLWFYFHFLPVFNLPDSTSLLNFILQFSYSTYSTYRIYGGLVLGNGNHFGYSVAAMIMNTKKLFAVKHHISQCFYIGTYG